MRSTSVSSILALAVLSLAINSHGHCEEPSPDRSDPDTVGGRSANTERDELPSRNRFIPHEPDSSTPIDANPPDESEASLSDDGANDRTPLNYQIKSYIAEYDMEVRGIRAGNITSVLVEEDGNWKHSKIAVTSGLASMFVDTVIEDSLFTLNGDEAQVDPVSYYVRDSGGDKWIRNHYDDDTVVRLVSHNIKKIGEGRVEQSYPKFKFNRPLLDESNWIFQATVDYLTGELPQRYQVTGFSGIREYEISFVREEDYLIGEELHPATVLRRKNIHRENDYMLLWLDRSNNYIPVNIERHKNDTKMFQTQLIIVSFTP